MSEIVLLASPEELSASRRIIVGRREALSTEAVQGLVPAALREVFEEELEEAEPGNDGVVLSSLNGVPDFVLSEARILGSLEQVCVLERTRTKLIAVPEDDLGLTFVHAVHPSGALCSARRLM